MHLLPGQLSRRAILAGFGGVAASAVLPRSDAAPARSRTALTLRLATAEAHLRGGLPPSPVWDFAGGPLPALTQGEVLDLTVANDLPVPVALNWRGGGVPASLEPLASPPVPPGQSFRCALPLSQAGTVLCDARFLGDRQARALPGTALRVLEPQPAQVDADHLVIISDWRLHADGTAVSPGQDPGDALAVFTVNGAATLDIPTRTHARLRFRFINACQRSVIAIKLDDHELRVMAIDSQPADPFVARGGLLLAPGSRIDAFVDAGRGPATQSTFWLHDGTSAQAIGRLVYEAGAPMRDAALAPPEPLPSNGLPSHIALATAHRCEIALDGQPDQTPGGWRRAADLTASEAPAFRVRSGSAVALTLINRAATAVTFHLHGHHVRWLDRLDDGWKPFWLDTLWLQPGQTLRTAFVAQHPGAWLMEAMGTDWAAPRLVRRYLVE